MSPWLLPHRFSMPVSASPAAPALPRPVVKIDAYGDCGREVADGVVAAACGNAIGAASAVEKVVALAADQRVISVAAREGHVRRIIGEIDRQGPREGAAVDVDGRVGHRGAVDGNLQGVDRMGGIRTEDQSGGGVGELDAFDAVDLAEIGIHHVDRAGECERIDAVAASDAQEGGAGDDEGVVARAAAQHVGAAIATRTSLPSPPTMSLGAESPTRMSSPAVPRRVT